MRALEGEVAPREPIEQPLARLQIEAVAKLDRSAARLAREHAQRGGRRRDRRAARQVERRRVLSHRGHAELDSLDDRSRSELLVDLSAHDLPPPRAQPLAMRP